MRLALTVALAVTVAIGLDPGGPLQGVERRTLDARHRHFARPTPHTEQIVILEVTEETIARLSPLYGRWPWPRSVHGEVIDYLAADGAAAIGFDLLFPEAALRRELGTTEWEALSTMAANADLPEVRTELQRRIEALEPGGGDRALVAAVARAGNVFHGAVFATSAAAPLAIAADPDTPIRTDAILPFTELARASRGVGHINVVPDSDGVYRRFEPLVWWKDTRAAYPALGVAIAAHVKNAPPATLRRERGVLAVGDARLPLLGGGTAWLKYQGGTFERQSDGSAVFRSFYRHVPYERVLEARDVRAAGGQPPLEPGAFSGKVVLVSAQAAGLSDLRATPFSAVTPGVELHANVIDSLLAGSFLRSPAPPLELLLVLAGCLAAALLARAVRPGPGAALTFGTAAALACGAWAAFPQGWVLPMVKPALGCALTWGSVLLARAVAEERERRLLRRAFGHYLAPAVLEDVLRAPERLRLGGERRWMTVLFSDIAGFTTLSEKLPPEAIGALLNGYLDRMTGCVTAHAGTLDKFIGDAVMAEWNAPLAQPDHAARACDAALQMLEEVERLRPAWEAAGASLEIRVGINTGDMLVGNMGSHQIFDFTVVGNEVNTASRLEALNKVYGTRVIVTAATRREAEARRPGRFAFRPLGGVRPKGRLEPLEIHELWGLTKQLGADAAAELEAFDAAMAHFLARRFADARRLFEARLERRPADRPAAFFAALCATWLENPPPADWCGVLVQTEK